MVAVRTEWDRIAPAKSKGAIRGPLTQREKPHWLGVGVPPTLSKGSELVGRNLNPRRDQRLPHTELYLFTEQGHSSLVLTAHRGLSPLRGRCLRRWVPVCPFCS